ncbi:MAG TPA: glutathione S-transferase N-terminal domain-containing protein [Rhizomicrobium sp.]|nr:glutathione S-transferase N-terminal domain-containing protein [Rhizomicrobium sp.]
MKKAKAAASGRNRAARIAAAKPKNRKTARRRAAHPPKTQKPIDLYYWPTPNGWKISIMLEECRLPYRLVPVNIGKGEQFEPAFLKISPNNRMPAIVDPNGPGGRPISVFESGAILQYLGRKTGRFYPLDERKRVAADEWLFWQVGGLGPMAGQANHFLNYAKEGNDYARQRYVDEVHRLLGVMNKRLADRRYLAGAYSIADMACWGWVISASRVYKLGEEFPHVKAWRDKIGKRPAVERGFALGRALREAQNADPRAQEEARKILFGQRARP